MAQDSARPNPGQYKPRPNKVQPEVALDLDHTRCFVGQVRPNPIRKSYGRASPRTYDRVYPLPDDWVWMSQLTSSGHLLVSGKHRGSPCRGENHFQASSSSTTENHPPRVRRGPILLVDSSLYNVPPINTESTHSENTASHTSLVFRNG